MNQSIQTRNTLSIIHFLSRKIEIKMKVPISQSLEGLQYLLNRINDVGCKIGQYRSYKENIDK